MKPETLEQAIWAFPDDVRVTFDRFPTPPRLVSFHLSCRKNGININVGGRGCPTWEEAFEAVWGQI